MNDLRSALVLWFAGFGMRPEIFDKPECEDALSEAIRSKDAERIRETIMRYSSYKTTETLQKPSVRLELMELVESGGKCLTPWTDFV